MGKKKKNVDWYSYSDSLKEKQVKLKTGRHESDSH